MTFDTHVYGKSVEDVIDSEVMRQLNKSNENLIGNFHQNMFKFVGGGWEVPQTGLDGFDVENHERHIFAEIKKQAQHDEFKRCEICAFAYARTDPGRHAGLLLFG